MKKIFLVSTFLLGSFTLSIQSSHAAYPVIDTAAIAKLVQQIQEMKKQYDLMKKQYDEVLATKKAVTGTYSVGMLENTPLDEMKRRIVPGSWQEITSLQANGKLPGIFAKTQEEFKKLLPNVDLKLFSMDPNNRNALGYKLSTDNTRAAFSATEAIYNQVQERLKTIENLTHEIDKTDNIKHATDLNSRISAENGFLNIDMARLNALQLSLQTALQNNQNQAQANHAEFFGTSIVPAKTSSSSTSKSKP